jgi:integrase/recombinase XerD
MLVELYSSKSHKTLERIRRSWLRELIDEFLSVRAAQRHRHSSLKVMAHDLIWFGNFVDQHGSRELSRLPEWIEPFLTQVTPHKSRRSTWRSAITQFLRFLMHKGLIPSPVITPVIRPHAELVEAYLAFTAEHRGVCREHLKNIRRFCHAFMGYLESRGTADLSALTPQVVQEFMTSDSTGYRRKTVSHRCAMLRGLLRHLYRRGLISVDLSAVVIAPRIYQQDQCPRFLTPPEVKAVLSAFNRQKVCGRRNYAMAVLLAVYGLRGIEVVRLCLDDIDWRNQKLYIRHRKAGNATTYPLAASAGEAVLSYLQNGRPQSLHRQIFLSTVLPFGPLRWTATPGRAIREAMAKAGIQVDRPGTHTFRYSCAQKLFEQGMPIKTVGDFLGHRDPNTTQRYTKIALEQLRTVALGEAEDLL